MSINWNNVLKDCFPFSKFSLKSWLYIFHSLRTCIFILTQPSYLSSIFIQFMVRQAKVICPKIPQVAFLKLWANHTKKQWPDRNLTFSSSSHKHQYVTFQEFANNIVNEVSLVHMKIKGISLQFFSTRKTSRHSLAQMTLQRNLLWNWYEIKFQQIPKQ